MAKNRSLVAELSTQTTAAHVDKAEETQLARIGAFSDGIFAIAMTLLVLTIEIPKIPDNLVSSELPKRLGEIFTTDLFAYFLSFAVIAIYWRIHHALFARIVRFDARLIFLNFVLLAFVALIPFPTQLISDYGDSPYAIATYAMSLTLVSVAALGLHYYACVADLTRDKVTRSQARLEVLLNSAPTVVFLASVPLAFVFGVYVPFFWLVLPFAEAALGRYSRHT